MPPASSDDCIQPVGVQDVTQDEQLGSAARQHAETSLARQASSGSHQAHELFEIIPRSHNQGDLEAVQPRSKLRIFAVMTALFVSSNLNPTYITYLSNKPIP